MAQCVGMLADILSAISLSDPRLTLELPTGAAVVGPEPFQ